jgi:hypothetical protein
MLSSLKLFDFVITLIQGQHTNHYSTDAVQKNSENDSAIDIDGKVWGLPNPVKQMSKTILVTH